MVSVATAPNDSSYDRSGTGIDDKEEEHQDQEIAKEPDSDATDTKVAGKITGKYLTKIAELQKSKNQLTAQYNRVLKQWDDNTRNHAHVIENKKTQVDGTKKRHKIEVSDLKAQLKRQQVESKDEQKAELQVKNEEQAKLHKLVKFYKREQMVNEAEIHKLQVAYTKEKASLSSSRLIYATSVHTVDQLTESNKELLSENKNSRRKFKMTRPPSFLTMRRCWKCNSSARSSFTKGKKTRGKARRWPTRLPCKRGMRRHS
jgi:hypothetical protein